MIHLISPAKSLDFDSKVNSEEYSIPFDLKKSASLIKKLKSQSKNKIKNLMSISDDLADLNQNRYTNWEGQKELSKNTRQAVFAFNGDVYQGLQASSLSEKDLEYAQDNLRILSGLYGVLKPLDVIEPHRLEMGTKLKVGRSNNLYDYWKKDVTKQLNDLIEEKQATCVLNLASNEYFKVVSKKDLNAEVISPEFKDFKNGSYKTISFFAKKARGLMSRYVIQNKIENVDDLMGFNEEGYIFNSNLSVEGKPVFTREENR